MKSSLYIFISLFLFIGCTGHKIESELRKAEELIGTRRFEEAVQVYRMIIARYPDEEKSAAAYLKMGDLYFYKYSKAEDALELYSVVIKKWPFSNDALAAALKKAEVYKTIGRLRRSLAELEWIRKHFPDYNDRYNVVLQIGEIYLALDDPYQTTVELKNILDSSDAPKEIYSKALYDTGECYLFMGKYDDAIEAFVRLENEYSDVPYIVDAKLRLVDAYEKKGSYGDARKKLEELQIKYPDSDVVRKKAEGVARREGKTEVPD